MTKGKSYNRIVFLTTLSVYLGLVLVGATPQALAFAATTRSFDIQNETELKDDLDNKPENEEAEIASQNVFPVLVAKLLDEIRAGVEGEKIAVPLPERSQRPAAVFEHFAEGFGSGGAGYAGNFQALSADALFRHFQPQVSESAGDDKSPESAQIFFAPGRAPQSLAASYSQSGSAQFTEFLSREFADFGASAENKLPKQVRANSKATSENDQVFIITRLPRAGIDSLHR